MGMVTGLPSSGIEYDVLSVRREMSVARSVPVVLPPVVSTMDSVGAGNSGLRESTPIMELRCLHRRRGHSSSNDPEINGTEILIDG